MRAARVWFLSPTTCGNSNGCPVCRWKTGRLEIRPTVRGGRVKRQNVCSVAGTSPATESCNYFFFGAAREAVFGFARAVVVLALVVAARFAGAFAVVFAITSPM